MPKPILDRIEICKNILQNDEDPSLRVEALWILADTLPDIHADDPLRDKVSDVLQFVLENDINAVVKHEACYLIGENNLRSKIPSLHKVISEDPSPLVRHEAIEALGLLQEFNSINLLQKSLSDQDASVSQTAEIVMRQLQRATNSQSLHTPDLI